MKAVVCGAKTRAGGPCQKPPLAGKQRCRLHGGLSLSGPAHPNYKDGRRSKVLPKRMREDYERALADDELMSLRNEIAVIDARIMDLLHRVDSGESGQTWNDLAAQVMLIDGAEDDKERAAAEVKLRNLIRSGAQDWHTWDELQRTFLTRERLVRSERKHLVEERLVIPLEHAQLLMTLFVDAAKEAVGHDPAVMGKIVEAFVRLTGYDPTSRQIIAAGGRDTEISERPAVSGVSRHTGYEGRGKTTLG